MAFVQSNQVRQSFQNPTISVALNGVVAGNSICGYVEWEDVVSDVSFSDNIGMDSYWVVGDPFSDPPDTPLRAPTAQIPASAVMFVIGSCVGGDYIITATITATNRARIMVHEIDNVDAAAPVIAHSLKVQIDPGTAVDAVKSGPIDTRVADDPEHRLDGAYIFGATVDLGHTTLPAPGTGFTARAGLTDLRSEDMIQNVAGVVEATFTGSVAAADYITGIMALRKMWVGPPVPVSPQLGY